MNSPFAIGEVSTCSPSAKFGDPYILPATPPSRLFFQSRIVGTPRGALLRTFTDPPLFIGAALPKEKRPEGTLEIFSDSCSWRRASNDAR